MPNYMLLLYAPHADAAEVAERDADLPVWKELTEEWKEAGTLVARGRLHQSQTATTVRRDERGEVELTDGPFAVTKEILGGYYILDLPDLDEALKHAARLPMIRYGAVEVRAIMGDDQMLMPRAGAAQQGA